MFNYKNSKSKTGSPESQVSGRAQASLTNHTEMNGARSPGSSGSPANSPLHSNPKSEPHRCDKMGSFGHPKPNVPSLPLTVHPGAWGPTEGTSISPHRPLCGGKTFSELNFPSVLFSFLLFYLSLSRFFSPDL